MKYNIQDLFSSIPTYMKVKNETVNYEFNQVLMNHMFIKIANFHCLVLFEDNLLKLKVFKNGKGMDPM